MESMPKLPKVTYTGSFKSVVAGTPGSVWKTDEDKPSYVDGRLIGRSKVLEFCLVRPGCWCKIPPPCVGLCAPFIACGSTCRTTCGSVCGSVCGPCFKLPGMCRTECGKVCNPICNPICSFGKSCWAGCWGGCGKVCEPICTPCRSFGKSCWLALVPFMCCVCCTCHPRKPSIEVEGDKRLQVGYPCHIEACWYCGGCSLDVTFLWDLCGCLGPTSDLMQNGHFEPRELHNSKWAAKIPEAKRSVPKLTAAPAAQTMDANTA